MKQIVIDGIRYYVYPDTRLGDLLYGPGGGGNYFIDTQAKFEMVSERMAEVKTDSEYEV